MPKAATKMSIKDKIAFALEESLPQYRGKDNEAKLFHDVLVWQEVASIADKNEKAAWKTVQTTERLIPTDDDMRDEGIGEHIIAEAGDYSCVATISAARKTFKLEKFIQAVAKRYKIDAATLTKMAEAACEEGKLTLSKRILEATTT
jgi:hypothetical protein